MSLNIYTLPDFWKKKKFLTRNFCILPWGNQSHVGGGKEPDKTPRLNNFSSIYYWADILSGVPPNDVLFGKVHEVPFFTLFLGVKEPSIRKKTVFWVQNFRKIAKKRVNRTKKVGTFYWSYKST